MSNASSKTNGSVNRLFDIRYRNECSRVNQFMVWLMLAQWIAGIGFAIFYSPLTWIGEQYEVHVHVWAAIILGGSISAFAILWSRFFVGSTSTRFVMAVCQVLWSALLIHLTGGRIETHFHVFASLATLSLYRDWKVLLTATVVVAVDHFVRGVFYPLSAFGIVTESPYRWIEHSAWVLFEISFLAPGCVMLRKEMFELCLRQTEIEEAKNSLDQKVDSRTAELSEANELLATKTREMEKLAMVARYTDNAVIITDTEAQIEWVNAGFERITGYSLAESIGIRPVDLLNGRETDIEQIQEMEKAIEKRQAYDFEMLRYRKNGEPFWMAIEARPIKNSKGEADRFILIESDITERIEAEQELKELNGQLVEASRVAGIAEIAKGVLHNVGNGLNSVNISASVIEKQLGKSVIDKLQRVAELTEEHQANFGDFVANDERGKKVPDYILKVSEVLARERKEMEGELKDLMSNVEHIKEVVAVQQKMAKSPPLMQVIPVSDIVHDVLLANSCAVSGDNVEIEVNIQDGMNEFVSDKRKIIQILVNLINNANEAFDESKAREPTIELSFTRSAEEVAIEVSDNGIGISQDRLNSIFQHGFTTKATGHGFGLHSSANAAAEIGGKLTGLSDGEGKGATFRLTLPIRGKGKLGANLAPNGARIPIRRLPNGLDSTASLPTQ